MCFYRTSEHRIADEPIVCYKIMAYYDHAYLLKQLAPTLYEGVDTRVLNSLNYPSTKPYQVGDEITASRDITPYYIDTLDELNGEVVHSYCNEDCFIGCLTLGRLYTPQPGEFGNYPWRQAIVRCEIPKGTPYWYNPEKCEYASKKLIIKEIIND